MTEKTQYESVQRSSFGSLVKHGIYDRNFEHGDDAKAFFRQCMVSTWQVVKDDNELVSILDCGCGPGAWLDFVLQLKDKGELGNIKAYGFDLTPDMITVARKRLIGRISAEYIKQGDILYDDSYDFGEQRGMFHIIYAYDVIQQLPRKLQFKAFQAMLRRILPGGCVIVFDHEANSSYGRKMALKKFITKHFGISLVPRYYCNARYPELKRFAEQAANTGNFKTEIKIAEHGNKRAIIVCALSK